MNFHDAFQMVVGHEGGISDHKDDPGGLTKYGITSRDYPSLDIRNLTLNQARRIYKSDYWDKIHGDDLPGRVAALVFDSAVNQGVSRATKLMQRALQVQVDGVIGKNTLTAAENVDPDEFAVLFGAERALHYASLSTFDTFGRGWMRRLLRTTIQVAK
jgi:lysozyme family protein